MKDWVKNIDDEILFSQSKIKKVTLNTYSIKNLLLKKKFPFFDKEELINELGDEFSFNTFENDDFNENFLITSKKKVYVRSFFYQTTTKNVQEELITFLFFQQIILKESFTDLLIDINLFLKDFLSSRQELLKETEFEHLYKKHLNTHRMFILGLIFTSLIYYNNYKKKLNRLEIKNLKEIFFPQKLKNLLSLEENAFEYIHKKGNLKDISEVNQNLFYKIKKIIDNNKIPLVDYVNNNLTHKKILFWGVWTMSPYLALDISLLLNLLNQTKIIKRIYLDLPLKAEPILKEGLAQPIFPEELVENEIKKIYPHFVEDYAKETLPYLVLLEKIKLFNIPFFFNGFPGEDIPYKTPKMSNEELFFDNEPEWEESIHLEYNKRDLIKNNEIIIFFFSLKPMHYFPKFLKKETQSQTIEKLIHCDPFLGYGPHRPENSLSLYSHYNPNKSYSFVLEKINNYFFKNEIINYYPHSKMLPYPIKNEYFNKFKLFDSLLYSSLKGGGGGGGDFDFDKNPYHPDWDWVNS